MHFIAIQKYFFYMAEKWYRGETFRLRIEMCIEHGFSSPVFNTANTKINQLNSVKFYREVIHYGDSNVATATDYVL